jgi:hypothetical protein
VNIKLILEVGIKDMAFWYGGLKINIEDKDSYHGISFLFSQSYMCSLTLED